MATHPKKAAAKATIKQILSCDVCDFRTKESAYAKQELGRHMKFTHGVAGASSSAQLMQSKKAPAKLDNIAMAMEPEPTVTEPPAKRTYNRRSTINVGYDTQALITVGKIIAACEAEAEKFNAPKESFTKRCAELFYASQIRT